MDSRLQTESPVKDPFGQILRIAKVFFFFFFFSVLVVFYKVKNSEQTEHVSIYVVSKTFRLFVTDPYSENPLSELKKLNVFVVYVSQTLLDKSKHT